MIYLLEKYPEIQLLFENKVNRAKPALKELSIDFQVGTDFDKYVQGMSFMDRINPGCDVTIAVRSNSFFVFGGTPNELKEKLLKTPDKNTVPTPERVLVKSSYKRLSEMISIVQKAEADMERWTSSHGRYYKPDPKHCAGPPPTSSKKAFMDWVDAIKSNRSFRHDSVDWFRRDDVTMEIIMKVIRMVEVKEVMES